MTSPARSLRLVEQREQKEQELLQVLIMLHDIIYNRLFLFLRIACL